MNNTNKKLNFVLYIVPALLIMAVVCMAVFSIVTGTKKNNDKKAEHTTARQTQNVTENKQTEKNPDTTYVTEEPNNEDVFAETDEPSQKTDAPVKLNITNPVSAGYLLKEYDIEMPVYSLTMNDYRVHTGIDILADIGAPVMAIAEGTVKNVYNDPMMGNCISISHANGLTSYYMGLSDEVYDGIEEGAPVYCGLPISSVGDSTLVEIAEETHLHFEMKKDGKYVNPMDYVSYEKTSSENVVDKNYEG